MDVNEDDTGRLEIKRRIAPLWVADPAELAELLVLGMAGGAKKKDKRRLQTSLLRVPSGPELESYKRM